MILPRFFLITGSFLSITSIGLAQNLVVNPGAELAPAATGWTVASSGIACAAGTAASTFNIWTMTPDNSANYPNAHGGTKTFYAGCSSTANTSYELYQDIDVSADATEINAGNVEFAFSGYIQTPVNTQADAGRFTVDFLNASNVVLGTSYTVVQSNSTGSGVTWRFYTNSRIAPVGTRTVRIRLIASIAATPAINAYFDDISLTKSFLSTLPVKLLSFSAQSENRKAVLNWSIADDLNLHRFEMERSTDQRHFTTAGVVKHIKGISQYKFTDSLLIDEPGSFYRLKMIDIDGEVTYSGIVSVKGTQSNKMAISPNPARGEIQITGLKGDGNLTITTANGLHVARVAVTGPTLKTNISHLPAGMYLVTYSSKGVVTTGKLVVE